MGPLGPSTKPEVEEGAAQGIEIGIIRGEVEKSRGLCNEKDN